MILIRDISKTIVDKLLFQGLSLTIQNKERVGLVGPNGSGKTTLLKIIAGMDYPDSGLVDTGKERIGFLEQKIEDSELEKTVGEFLKNFKLHEIEAIYGKLKFNHPEQTSIETLSGGEKTKLALIKVLLEKPSVLLLDEPTNHLDADSSAWLIEFLENWHGTILTVSHDRGFLNKAVNKILEFDPVRHEIHSHEGNYDSFAQSKKLKDQKWQTDYEQQQKDLQKMRAFIKEKQRQSHMTSDPAIGKQIRQMEKRIQREILDSEIVKPASTLKIPKQQLRGEGHTGKLILRLTGVDYRTSGKQLFQGLSAEMRGKDRVRLQGKNGSGKTTLAQLVLGEIKPAAGEIKIGENVKIGYFDQEHLDLPSEKLLIDYAHSLPHRGDDRAFLAHYGFTGISINKQIGTLSQGEQVRLIIARLLLEAFDLLILDEPTNHLDIESREIIEQAISGYEGALLVISHDQYLVEQININKTWHLENGTIKESIV